ncbi:MAG TPA: hypothetical protein VK116_03810, partial [Planctomycetota bacterium]|nr:hypothetical protein [Planctomycetota bacterium]
MSAFRVARTSRHARSETRTSSLRARARAVILERFRTGPTSRSTFTRALHAHGARSVDESSSTGAWHEACGLEADTWLAETSS